MEDAIGTLVLIAAIGCVFGDQAGKKAAPYLLLIGLLLAFILSPAFALALIVAPFAGIIMLIVAGIALIKRL